MLNVEYMYVVNGSDDFVLMSCRLMNIRNWKEELAKKGFDIIVLCSLFMFNYCIKN